MDRDFGINQAFVEEIYLRYRENRHAVDESWRRYFDALEADATAKSPASPNGNGNSNGNNATYAAQGNGNGGATSLPYAPAQLTRHLSATTVPAGGETTEAIFATAAVHALVYRLINAYRTRGHLFADLDPLALQAKPAAELTLERFGLSEGDLDTQFPTGDLAGPDSASLREIITRCEETYCRSIGVEFMHLESLEERGWLMQRMESSLNKPVLTPALQKRILTKLTDAEIFELFLDVNFRGAKRFSGEGTESMIPLMDLLVEEAGRHGVEEVVIGMAHRGRLNVLANIMGKPVREIFSAFQEYEPEKNLGRGDVKYHLGYSSDRTTETGQPVHLSLAFNPSHLEFVGAVVEGRVRAKQDRRGDNARKKVIPLVLHGDAAFMGQGIVAETLNMANLPGYSTGGTIHVVINNQVGFTTNTEDSRSTRYCSDVMRLLRAPVFHVNGEDPEAVAQVVTLAVEYRQKFGRDVCIDLYGYRKHGHNETDEPRLTQPLMYSVIDKKPSVRQMYIKRLAALGAITEGDAEAIAADRRAALEADLAETRKAQRAPVGSAFAGLWARYRGGTDAEVPEVDTTVPTEKLIGLLETMTQWPEGAKVRRQVLDTWNKRVTAAKQGDATLDWGAGECLAFASLLSEGTRIRLSGQDARRGTFSHRHSVVTDSETGARFCPYDRIARGPATFEVYDSPLSEAGVMGFDYGYSLDYPDGLVIWEAQFGDFANGAQVIIDQFLSAAEDKWNRLSGLVLLLPHGFEGQGPEHSSARLERFLQLCAEDNMYVCNMTTSAQLFHVLRRQVHRPLRKPLVIMSPKSLLRQSFSSIGELASGGFQRVLADASALVAKDGTRTEIDPSKVERILLCSGKVFYDLEAARLARGATNVAIVRLEQLYPLSKSALEKALALYPSSTPIVWVQEEPWNMGAWYYVSARLPGLLGRPLSCVAREESASPATGSPAAHKIEHAMLLDAAFKLGG